MNSAKGNSCAARQRGNGPVQIYIYIVVIFILIKNILYDEYINKLSIYIINFYKVPSAHLMMPVVLQVTASNPDIIACQLPQS